MMAKMFYTLEDVKSALGKDDDEIKALTRDGRLREFRDGPRLMFKADQVEALKSELEGGGGDRIDLGPSDSGAPIGLVDSRSGSGAILSLSDSIGGPPSSELKNDTALAADLGLSASIGLSQSLGSIGGMPSPARPGEGSGGSGSGLSGLSGTSTGSKGGINMLGGDEDADPSAQTAVNPAMNENMNLEGMGSGSGLLDLTRESDNTSLGAVLDEIGGGSLAGGSLGGGSLGGASLGGTRAAETIGGTGMPSGMGNVVQSSRVITPPTYVEAKDALAPAFGGAALMSTIVVIIGILALSGGVMGVRPALIEQVAKQTFTVLALGSVGLALLGFIFGLLLGKIRA